MEHQTNSQYSKLNNILDNFIEVGIPLMHWLMKIGFVGLAFVGAIICGIDLVSIHGATGHFTWEQLGFMVFWPFSIGFLLILPHILTNRDP